MNWVMSFFIVNMMTIEWMCFNIVRILLILVWCVERLTFSMVCIVEIGVRNCIRRCKWMFMNFHIVVETLCFNWVNSLIDLMLVWTLIVILLTMESSEVNGMSMLLMNG